MKTTHHSLSRLWIAVAALVAVNVVAPARADVISKADNNDALNLGSSWVGGVAPGAGDIATWDAALAAGSRTTALGDDLEWQGLTMTADPGGNVVFSAGNILTLGKDGITVDVNRTLVLRNITLLGTDQSWLMYNGKIEGEGQINTDGHTLTLNRRNNQFKGHFTGGGDIIVTGASGQLQMSSGSTATDSTIFISPGTQVFFDVQRGTRTRAASVEVTGGTLRMQGDSLSGGVAQTDIISGNLKVAAGATVQVQPNASGYAQLLADELVFGATPSVLFRGNNLGVNSIASLSVNSASIDFTTAPALTGGGGAAGTPTVNILAKAYGDRTNAGTGTGFVTYDTTYGIRVLDVDTEYSDTLVDGQSTLNNVLLANESGMGVLTNLLTSPLTIVNSLTLQNTGTGGDGGIDIAGDEGTTLRIASGSIYVNQAAGVSRNVNDSIWFTVPTLDFNGRQGTIVRHTTGTSNGTSVSPLRMQGDLTNDGGEGIVFDGTGLTYYDGSEPFSYTGPTVVNGGHLRLMKSVSNIAIPGDLVLYGGTIQNTGNQLPSTADIYVHGGTFRQKGGATNSGSGASETFQDLFQTGGTFESGASGTSSGGTTMRAATLTGGSWSVTRGHKLTLSGLLDISNEGYLSLNRNESGSRTTIMTLNGGLRITNADSRPFIPIRVIGGSSSTADGGTIILADDLEFIGNVLNENTALIEATEPAVDATWGVIRLDGTRTFNIGDGAAATDLTIQPFLADNGATVGSLVKTGAGTLALDGANTFTGGTLVNVGTLAGNGSLASDVTVATGAAIAPGTPGTVGTLTVDADVDFAAGSALQIDAIGATADLLAVTGAVTGTGTVTVTPTIDSEDDEWLVMTAASIEPTFVSTDATWHLSKRAGGTQLWMTKTGATLILVR